MTSSSKYICERKPFEFPPWPACFCTHFRLSKSTLLVIENVVKKNPLRKLWQFWCGNVTNICRYLVLGAKNYQNTAQFDICSYCRNKKGAIFSPHSVYTIDMLVVKVFHLCAPLTMHKMDISERHAQNMPILAKHIQCQMWNLALRVITP